MDLETYPCLPRVSVTTSVIKVIAHVDECIVSVLHNYSPSLLQCVHLLYAAANRVHELLSKPLLINLAVYEDSDWSLTYGMVACGYPLCGSRR